MKSLKDFIIESAFYDVKTLIKSLKIDFSETANMSSGSKTDRAKKAKAQEKILVDTINGAQDDFKAIGIEEYCKSIGKTYSYELDSKLGDVVILKNDKPEMFIDLKVAETNKYYGTPDMLSLINFASTKDDKKYYLCCRIDGVDSKLFEANKLYNIMVTKKGIVVASNDRDKISPEVKDLTDKVKIVAPVGSNNVDTSKLYDNDFVATPTLDKVK